MRTLTHLPPSLNPSGEPFPPLPPGSPYAFPHPREFRGFPSNRGVPLPIRFPYPNPLPWGSLSFPLPLPLLPSHPQPGFVEVLERFFRRFGNFWPFSTVIQAVESIFSILHSPCYVLFVVLIRYRGICTLQCGFERFLEDFYHFSSFLTVDWSVESTFSVFDSLCHILLVVHIM